MGAVHKGQAGLGPVERVGSLGLAVAGVVTTLGLKGERRKQFPEPREAGCVGCPTEGGHW